MRQVSPDQLKACLLLRFRTLTPSRQSHNFMSYKAIAQHV